MQIKQRVMKQGWRGSALRLSRALIRAAVLLAVALLCAPSLYAQNSPMGPQWQGAAADYRWATFTRQSGGPASNNVWALAASEGAIWAGDELGVSRFDGLWTSFPAYGADGADASVDASADALPDGAVHALALGTHEGEIWAGTSTGVVYAWDGEGWSQAGSVAGAVLALVEWQGNLYIGAARGLYCLNHAGVTAEDAFAGAAVYALRAYDGELWAGSEDGLWRLIGENWRREADAGGLFAQGVFALGETGDGRLAAGVAQGLAIRDAHAAVWQLLPLRDEDGREAAVRAVAVDRDGRVWAGTDGAGAFEIEPPAGEGATYAAKRLDGLTSRFVRAIAVDEDGSVWFGTPAGVFRVQAGIWMTDVQGGDEADPINYINDLLVDRQGRLWIATGGGGIRLKRQPFAPEKVFDWEDGLPTRVLVLAEDSVGAIWAGTFEGLFRFAHGVWRSPFSQELLPSDTVTALLADGPVMWVGTDAGLVRYDARDDSVQEQPALAGQSIEALMLDGQAVLWAGTRAAGLWQRQADGSWSMHLHDPTNAGTLPGNWIISSGLAPDWRAPGSLWAIVHQKGLAYWDGRTWSNGDAGGHIAGGLIWTLEADADAGMLWVGSEAGVTRYDGRTWGSLTPEDGLHGPVVYAVAQAKDGSYWMGGPAGLTRYRPDTRPPWIKVSSLPANRQAPADGALDVTVGQPLLINITAGDLQTPQSRLKILRRQSGPAGDGPWEEIRPGTVESVFAEGGAYQLEFVARDQSFNYSQPVVQRVNAILPAPKVHVPGLGLIGLDVARALAALGLASVLGTGYVAFEVVRHRRRSIDAVNRNFNPYVSGEPVRRNDMFYARRGLVQRIVNMLHNNSIMIHGERRIGKTTLLFQLMAVLREAEDPDYWFVPIYVDLEGTAQESFFHFLIEEVIDGVQWLPDAEAEILPKLETLRCRDQSGAAYADHDFNRDLRRIIDVLHEYGAARGDDRQLRVILLLDEMDVMSKYDHLVQQQLRRIFMREFATTVGAVVAGIRISKDWDRVESPWYNLFNEIELEPFTPEQALELLIAPVQGYYRYTPEAIAFVLEQTGGRPYRVQQYGLEAVNRMLAERRRKIGMDDVLAAHEHIEANTAPCSGIMDAAPSSGIVDAAPKGGMPTGNKYGGAV